MLKRQRTSSPIPWSAEPTVEADAAPGDLYEPSRKRRRYFTTANLDKSLWTGSDNDTALEGELEVSEDKHGKRVERAANGVREWEQQAGQYKDANILLHDLHAEQRHRMLFAIGSSPHSTSYASSSHMAAQGSIPDNAFDHGCELPPPVEAKRVAERYEDANKRLGSLFLNRRRQLDATTSHEEPSS